jgi:hypothetical protein
VIRHHGERNGVRLLHSVGQKPFLVQSPLVSEKTDMGEQTFVSRARNLGSNDVDAAG